MLSRLVRRRKKDNDAEPRNDTVSTQKRTEPPPVQARSEDSSSAAKTPLFHIPHSVRADIARDLDKRYAAQRERKRKEAKRYRYTPLNPDRNEIRLLRLKKRYKWTQGKVHAGLSVVSLDQGIRFTALSYEWSPQQEIQALRRVLVLDGGYELEIKPNLATFFEHCGQHGDSLLWIDALCINQRDIEEKVSQLRKMFTIYAKASTVLAWLGPGKYGDSDTLQMLNDLSAAMTRHVCPTVASQIKGIQDTIPPTDDEINISLIDTDDLSAFAGSSYWRRTWVVQEVSTDVKSVILRCGASEFHLGNAVHVIADHYAAAEHSLSILGEAAQVFSHILDQPILSLAPDMTLARLKGPSRLLYLLWRYRTTLSTDKRDKIYGTLAFSQDAFAHRIPVDYHVPWQEVYKRTAEAIIRESNSLWILVCAGSTAEALPTWVPDWSKECMDYAHGREETQPIDPSSSRHSQLGYREERSLEYHSNVVRSSARQFYFSGPVLYVAVRIVAQVSNRVTIEPSPKLDVIGNGFQIVFLLWTLRRLVRPYTAFPALYTTMWSYALSWLQYINDCTSFSHIVAWQEYQTVGPEVEDQKVLLQLSRTLTDVMERLRINDTDLDRLMQQKSIQEWDERIDQSMRALPENERSALLLFLESSGLQFLLQSNLPMDYRDGHEQRNAVLERSIYLAHPLLRGRTTFQADAAAGNPENPRLKYFANEHRLDQHSTPRLALQGLIRAATQPGDYIAIIPDCPMPLVIRERRTSNNSVFRVIGAALIPEFNDIQPWYATANSTIQLV